MYAYGSLYGSPAYAWGVAVVSCTDATGAPLALASGTIHLEVSDVTANRHAFGSNTTALAGYRSLSSGRVVLTPLVHGDTYQLAGSARVVVAGQAPVSINFRPASHILP